MQNYLSQPMSLPDFSIESAKMAIESPLSRCDSYLDERLQSGSGAAPMSVLSAYSSFGMSSPPSRLSSSLRSTKSSSKTKTIKNDDATSVVSASSSDEAAKMLPLPRTFIPTIHHVICGRGKKCYGHIGNKHFLSLATSYVEAYEHAKSKQAKSSIVQAVVDEVNIKGGFVRLETKTGRYFVAEDQEGREKTSQALRDFLKDKYKSSKDIKRKNRKQKRLAKQAIHEDLEEQEEEEQDNSPSSNELKSYINKALSTLDSADFSSLEQPVHPPSPTSLVPRRVSNVNFEGDNEAPFMLAESVPSMPTLASSSSSSNNNCNIIFDDISEEALESMPFFEPLDGLEDNDDDILSEIGDWQDPSTLDVLF